MKIPQCIEGNENEKLMWMEREASIIVAHLNPVRHFIAVGADWIELYIGNELGNFQDCYLAEIVDNWENSRELVGILY